MNCDTGRLRAYLDDALQPQEQDALTRHLAECASCREELAALRQRACAVQKSLAALQQQTCQAPDAALALSRFRTRVQHSQPSLWASIERRFEMSKRAFLSGRWRPVAIGAVVLLLLVGLFSLAPIRQAAADFLGIFRVRKFAVISVDPARLQQLEGLESMAEGGAFGQPTILRQPGQPQTAADAAAASALAGFQVRVPQSAPEGATAGPFNVAVGPAMRMETDGTTIQMVLDAAGVQGVSLSSLGQVTIELDVPMVVEQSYRVGRYGFSIIQMPSPTVTYPHGLNPAQAGEALLQMLGVPADEARRLARSIDWTSTLLIPLPTNIARFREVEVAGTSGLFLEGQAAPASQPAAVQISSSQPTKALLWQRDGILYAVIGNAIASDELLRVADSLR